MDLIKMQYQNEYIKNKIQDLEEQNEGIKKVQLSLEMQQGLEKLCAGDGCCECKKIAEVGGWDCGVLGGVEGGGLGGVEGEAEFYKKKSMIIADLEARIAKMSRTLDEIETLASDVPKLVLCGDETDDEMPGLEPV